MPRDLTARELPGLTRIGQHRVSRNLYLQVTPTGTRSWLFRYMLAGKARWLGLGPTDLVTLAEARAKATAWRRRLLEGGDPIEDRRAARARTVADSLTFQVCAERYTDAHQASWRNGKHRAQWKATLATYVLSGARRAAGRRGRHRPGHAGA